MKLGLLIGGSDAPGLNAVIRAVVRTAVGYGYDVIGVSNGFEGLLRPPELWPLGVGDVRGLGRQGGTILGACNRGNPFDANGQDRSDEVRDTMRWSGIDALILVGGDGSLSIADRLSRQGVPVVGIPKTIENDLPGTGVTFGYSTAVEIATDAIDKLQTSRETRHRVMLLEVCGRRAGWVALSAGIAGAADAILIPEVPWRADVLAELVRTREAAGKPSTVIVVAESAREAGAPPMVAADGPVAVRVGKRLASLAPTIDLRVTVLGPLQRGGAPNSQDRILATRFGAAAVRAAHEGQHGQMVEISGSKVGLVPLAVATGPAKGVDPGGELAWTAIATGISLGASPADIRALAPATALTGA